MADERPSRRLPAAVLMTAALASRVACLGEHRAAGEVLRDRVRRPGLRDGLDRVGALRGATDSHLTGRRPEREPRRSELGGGLTLAVVLLGREARLDLGDEVARVRLSAGVVCLVLVSE